VSDRFEFRFDREFRKLETLDTGDNLHAAAKAFFQCVGRKVMLVAITFDDGRSHAWRRVHVPEPRLEYRAARCTTWNELTADALAPNEERIFAFLKSQTLVTTVHVGALEYRVKME
jgi:hypothetical protein